ncbi:UNVERIFIED_CONTAM: hypothetical protein HDU68_003085 [Siphonaria sp. JEL0065]|nr:hypothetical protein HDU68_003085 [Siphonaria sp. JEL0065]
MRTSLLSILVLLVLATCAFAWEKEDFAIFDLHDKLIKIKGEKDASGKRTDFYNILDIPRTATPIQLSRAYRKHSLELHPDKNPEPQAAALYALLTSIHGVLKDKEMRERYDAHLKKGIPTWRGTGYFLARYKPGLPFILTFVVLAISVSQYLIQYTQYYLLKKKAETEVVEVVEEKTSNDLTYNNLRRMLKKAGHAEPPAAVKTAIRKGVAVAEILKFPELAGLISEEDQKEEFREEATDSLSNLDKLKPSLNKTLIVQLPEALIGLPAWFSKKASEKKEVVVEGGDVEEAEASTDEAPKKVSKKALKKQEQQQQQQQNGDEDATAQEEVVEKKKRKKSVNKNVLKSSTGVVMTKAEFLKKTQEEQAKALAAASELDGYPTYFSVIERLEQIAKAQPSLATYETIGATRSGLTIPALTLHYNHPSNIETGAIDLRPHVVLMAQVQPREVLSLVTLLGVVDKLVDVASDASSTSLNDDPILGALKAVRIVVVPIVNPEGFEELRLNYPTAKEDIMKNGAPGCQGGNVSTNGVNLGHNWDFEWNYPVISSDDYTDPCNPSYRGPEPFSEPETRALRDLILKTTPKTVLIIHSHHTSPESRLIVPFMFHKSTFLTTNSTPANTKLKLLSDPDIETYKTLTEGMQAVFKEEDASRSGYSVGTSWETIGKTISGSDLDWIFDNTNTFSVVLQVGTVEGTYWPDLDLAKTIAKRHLSPIMKFIQLSPTLAAKTTAKTQNSSILKHFSRIPFYLGVSLFLVIAGVLGTSWCLGYDKVWDRFKTWAQRMERKLLHGRRKQYIGVRSSVSPTRRSRGGQSSSSGGGGLLRTRNASGDRDEGGSSSSHALNRLNTSINDEEELVGLEDLIHDDDDDEGTGFSYRT